MKHYKVRCYRSDVESDHVSGSVFIDIYAQGSDIMSGLLDAQRKWVKHYSLPFDIFDYVSISYEWSDEDVNN